MLSTPDAPERAILQGVEQLGLGAHLRAGRLRIIHGTTIATNAALQGQGARTALICNEGMTDLLTIGRQARDALYSLHVPAIEPPVPADLCFGVDARTGTAGESLRSPSTAALARLAREVTARRVEAVAVSLLFSYLAPEQEQRIAAALPEGLFVSCAHDVLPRIGEYERTVATWLNARLGPLVAGYLGRLRELTAPSTLAVMQSDGMTLPAADAPRRAVRLLLSGPAGGLAAAGLAAREQGLSDLLTFDMGGTSTDVAALQGEPRLTAEGAIGPYPLAIPSLDIHTIGAGGGSLASVDQGGILHVGPNSAGADPGPACYGRGGAEATVTDANVVLGRLPASLPLGGSLQLDEAAARAALGRLGSRLGISAGQAAAGVVQLANEHMAAALRRVSVARGLDPAGFSLCCFGGAGGLHVCELAELLRIRQVLVPVHAGIFSALGMLAAAPGRSRSVTREIPLRDADPAVLEREYAGLERALRDELLASASPGTTVHCRRTAELRYAGQSFTLTLPWQSVADTAAAFHQLHKNTYGHAFPGLAVELVHVGVQAHTAPGLARFPAADATPGAARAGVVAVSGCPDPVPLYRREALAAGARIPGPALISEQTTITYVKSGWHAHRTLSGSLLLRTGTPGADVQIAS